MNHLLDQLKRARFQPTKSAGQNFLINDGLLDRIAEAAQLTAADSVVEIGSGPGNLTRRLAERAGHVWAVERDKHLLPLLSKSIKPFKQKVEIVADDIFRWRSQQAELLAAHPYVIVANLPYYLTSRVLKEFLTREPKPDRLIVLVQKEVAERITAAPGAMSLLSLSVQYYGQPELVFTVDRREFWPAPEVDSALLRIRDIRPSQPTDAAMFWVAKMAFAGKRKQLHNTLAAGLRLTTDAVVDKLRQSGIDPKTRPQELSVEQWQALAQLFSPAK